MSYVEYEMNVIVEFKTKKLVEFLKSGLRTVD